jgi:alkylated DNA repair dioxygenase AlkB
MAQIDIFGGVSNNDNSNKLSGTHQILNGEYLFLPNFFDGNQSNDYFSTLRKEIDWKQESMKLYGKQINFPRLTAWYGDSNKPYSFSGITLQPNSWTDDLMAIKSKIAPIAQVDFNSVLLNLYRSGNDSISWHTDAEKELGINPVIASVNFGETRTFQLRHIKTKEKIEIELTNGSLLIMRGETQHYWQHQVPKTSKIVKERINLTFRVLK